MITIKKSQYVPRYTLIGIGDELNYCFTLEEATRIADALNAPRLPVVVPDLEIDEIFLRKYNQPVTANGRLERRIVAGLCAHMAQHGFLVNGVHDGEEETLTYTVGGAMNLIFNLDEARLYFRKENPMSVTDVTPRQHSVYLVLGNGVDVISDWSFFIDDHDGFNAAMEAFDAEKFA